MKIKSIIFVGGTSGSVHVKTFVSRYFFEASDEDLTAAQRSGLSEA
jgi:hypothetical protein